MALQVWLPLQGDLKNQGLTNITLDSGSPTYTNGKLGQCLNTGTLLFTAEDDLIVSLGENNIYSMCCWCKNLSTSASSRWVFYIGGDASGLMRGLWESNSTTNRHWAYSGSGVNIATSINTIDGQWHHLCFTSNGATVKLYVDGIYQSQITNGKTDALAANHIYLNASNYNLNDFRLYDHCLSPMEVKELSKGLVLHYPLNRGGWGQENLFNWSNNATGITLNDYQNKGSFTQFTNSLTFDPSATVGKKYTISFWAKSPNGTTPLQLYNANSNPKYFYFGSTTLTSSLGTEWQFFKYTVTNTQYSGSGTASTNTSIWKRIEIYAPNQMKVQVKQIKVEEGEVATPWCPNSSDNLADEMGLNGTTEYDCSGYCNNGTRTGTFEWTSDTPKYEVSTIFNGSNCVLSDSPTTEGATLAAWVKVPSIVNGAYFIDYKSGLGFGTWNNYLMPSCNASIKTTYKNTNFTINEWNHIVVVKRNSTTVELYINGILQPQHSTTDSWTTGVIDKLSLAARPNGTNLMSCQLSDFRIYATALSADDVKSLYQNSAYIDSSGNVYGAVYSEV